MNIISIVVGVGRGAVVVSAAEISGRVVAVTVAVTVNDRRSGRVVCSRNVTTIAVIVVGILVVRIYILLLVQGHGQFSCARVYYYVVLVGRGDGRVKSPRCERINTGGIDIRYVLQYAMLLLLLLLLLLLKMVFRIHFF